MKTKKGKMEQRKFHWRNEELRRYTPRITQFFIFHLLITEREKLGM
jgi:hypothetical protein